MARSVNKVTLIGNLGNDPDMKALPSGSQVANLSLATTDSWRDKNSSEMQERTEWHRVVFFDRLADICGQYLKKVRGCMLTEICDTLWEQDGEALHTEIVVAQ
jgi:single stranded DNA-binding protein (ssb)